ncbi:hypothetical protein PHYBOEH_008355 [Phytophthora boehmeriae]|uniref:Kazal-like domain-containing protein n=1 Tax=Phytophthora boehmeriae TaxID=109152 RepID=A0A8T1W1G5_9STRA|nr:hypothetical protein PHYBOEH_008355 [Phytophthora boehmeriae]
MKLSVGLMLAAVAFTVTHAGNLKTLRGSASFNDCPDTCPEKYKPVSDDNGVEYLNKCYLKMSQCRGTGSGSVDEGTQLYMDFLHAISLFLGSGSSEDGAIDEGSDLVDQTPV